MKLLSLSARLECLNFLKALSSICRIRSRVRSKSCPTSQGYDRASLRSRTASSESSPPFRLEWRGLFESALPYWNLSLPPTAKHFLSSIKSPERLSSSSPIGVSSEIGFSYLHNLPHLLKRHPHSFSYFVKVGSLPFSAPGSVTSGSAC